MISTMQRRLTEQNKAVYAPMVLNDHFMRSSETPWYEVESSTAWSDSTWLGLPLATSLGSKVRLGAAASFAQSGTEVGIFLEEKSKQNSFNVLRHLRFDGGWDEDEDIEEFDDDEDDEDEDEDFFPDDDEFEEDDDDDEAFDDDDFESK